MGRPREMSPVIWARTAEFVTFAPQAAQQIFRCFEEHHVRRVVAAVIAEIQIFFDILTGDGNFPCSRAGSSFSRLLIVAVYAGGCGDDFLF